MALSWLREEAKGTPAKTITDADYADDLALLANTPNQAETLLHSLERAAAGIGLHVNANKTEYMCYNQTGNIATLDGASLKLVDKFTYLGSSVSSTEKDIDTQLTKAWTAIDRLSIIWKSDLTDKMKRSFFQAAVVSILLYGCTTWTLTKRLERRLDGNYTRMLRAVLNKSWRQHPTRLQLYGHLPPITKTIHGCPRGVLVKAMDCGIVVREFVLQSRYYVHFRANTLGKGMNPLISLQLWVNSRAD